MYMLIVLRAYLLFLYVSAACKYYLHTQTVIVNRTLMYTHGMTCIF